MDQILDYVDNLQLQSCGSACACLRDRKSISHIEVEFEVVTNRQVSILLLPSGAPFLARRSRDLRGSHSPPALRLRLSRVCSRRIAQLPLGVWMSARA